MLTEKISKAGHNQRPAFGIGTELRKGEWQSVIRQLVAAQFLQLDVQGYGGLTITLKGEGLMRGQENFHYRKDTLKKNRAANRKIRDLATVADLPDADTALLAELRKLRLRLAKSRGVPAYVIFPDRSLVDMARQKPTTVDEFAAIHGVGAAKLRDFGETFVTTINRIS